MKWIIKKARAVRALFSFGFLFVLALLTRKRDGTESIEWEDETR